MGFCHPYPSTKNITDKGENKIRCMRVLFNFPMFKANTTKNYFSLTLTVMSKCFSFVIGYVFIL